MSRPFPDHLFEREESRIINPHDRLCQPADAIPASSLRLEYHFVTSVPSNALFDETKDKFRAYYNRVVKSSDYGYNAPRKLREAMFDILNKGEILKEVIPTEQVLRCCVCDPLVEMICKMWNLKVVLEETVKRSMESTSTSSQALLPSTPQSSKTRQSISDCSHSDYTCYRLESTNKESIVVIIEAKLTANAAHVEAQAIGYFITLPSTESSKPALVLIVTQQWIKVILFPFVSQDKDLLVNAVAFNKLDLWRKSYGEQDLKPEGEIVNPVILHLILVLTCPDITVRMRAMLLPEPYKGVRKIHVKDAVMGPQTLEKKRRDKIKELEAEAVELEADKQELQAENQKLKEMSLELHSQLLELVQDDALLELP